MIDFPRYWISSEFGSFVKINPKVLLRKGDIFPFIPMEDLNPNYKFVKAKKEKEFTGGGVKFENKDTIFARITPCLQNGKIAQAKNLVGGKGFGSTEYFIFRAKQGISDNDFIYYLSQTTWFQQNAINSMVGASGRQRADACFISKTSLILPPLSTQQKIAAILSAYDDLIENNLQRIKLLEEMAQITYEEWFVRMKFPGHEHTPIDPETGLPEGWKKSPLRYTCTLIMGQSPKSEFYNYEQIGLPFHQGVKDYGRRFPSDNCWTSYGLRIAKPGDILFSVRAPVGRLNIALKEMVLGRGLSAIRHNEGEQSFIFYQLQNIFFEEDMMGGGAIFSSVTKKDMMAISLLIPSSDIQKKFNIFAANCDESILTLHNQNQLLKEARDILLPRLMTGMIDVETIELPEALLARMDSEASAA